MADGVRIDNYGLCLRWEICADLRLNYFLRTISSNPCRKQKDIRMLTAFGRFHKERAYKIKRSLL